MILCVRDRPWCLLCDHDYSCVACVCALWPETHVCALWPETYRTQALVEFQRSEDAAAAIDRLHGENVYSGCNRLSIQWSNLSEVSVKTNNDRTWDFSMPGPQSLSTCEEASSPYARDRGRMSSAQGGPVSALPRSPVVLVSHLDEEKVTVQALFNLMSLAGLVSRVKILYQRRDSALVQYESADHAQNACACLSGCPLWGKFVLVSPSKHASVQANKSDLEPSPGDGKVLFGDFATSTYHRCGPKIS